MIVNQSMVDRGASRTDITTVFVPGNEMAEEIGNRRLLNMVMLGALLTRLPELSIQDIETALAAHLPERHKKLLPQNRTALQRGYDFALQELEKQKN